MWIPKRKIAVEKNAVICDLFRQGKSVTDISKMLNIKTRGQVYKHLWAGNVSRRPYTKVLTENTNVIQ